MRLTQALCLNARPDGDVDTVVENSQTQALESTLARFTQSLCLRLLIPSGSTALSTDSNSWSLVPSSASPTSNGTNRVRNVCCPFSLILAKIEVMMRSLRSSAGHARWLTPIDASNQGPFEPSGNCQRGIVALPPYSGGGQPSRGREVGGDVKCRPWPVIISSMDSYSCRCA